MAWKDLAEVLQAELRTKHDEIAGLRRQLAKHEEKLVSTSISGSRPGHVQHVLKLQAELESIRTKKDEYAQKSAESNELFQNTLAKLDKVEKQSHEELAILKNLLASKNEALRRIQATRASDQSTSAREKGLMTQIDKFKTDLSTAKAEAGRLRTTNQSLSRQLQVEKAENANRLGFMRSDPSKVNDQDDEEPLPREDAVLKEQSKMSFALASEPPLKKFRPPIAIPDFLKQPDSIGKKNSSNAAPKNGKNGKIAAPGKRKRSSQEDIDAEFEDPDTGTFEMPSEPRRKRNTAYRGSYEMPDPDGNDIFMPDAALLDKPKIKTGTTKKKPFPVAPLTPVSAISPSFELPITTDFKFTAVCDYRADGSVGSRFHSADLKTMTELWDRIGVVNTSIWEANFGEDWTWEFQKPDYKPKTPACVSAKCMNKRTRWHAGLEGIYACEDCSVAGRPCFAYVKLEGEDHWEFRLLPLHETDRKRGVTLDKEIRYWVNDCVKLVDPDEVDESEVWA